MNILKKISAICICISLSTGLTACGNNVPELIKSNTALKVYYTVEKGNISSVKTYSACVTPEFISVEASLSGEAYDIGYKAGDTVKEGDVIFSVDADYEKALEHLKYKYETYETICDYYEQQNNEIITSMNNALASMSGMEYELYKLDIEKMALDFEMEKKNREAEYNELKSQYETLLEGAGGSDIIAPCDGIIVSLSVGGGKTGVESGDSVLTIADTSVKYVELDYSYYNEIKELTDIEIQIGEKKYSDVQLVEYTIAEMNEYELLGKKYNTRFVIDDLDSSVDAGTYAFVSGKSSEAKDCIYVPNESVYPGDTANSYYCIRLNKNGNEERVPVTTGITTDYYTEIVSGLSVGDEVYYMDDCASWTSEPESCEVKYGSYESYDVISGLEMDSLSYPVECPVSGKIGEVYVTGSSDFEVEKGQELFTINPTVKDSEIERVLSEYAELSDSVKTSIESYDGQISDKEEQIKNAANQRDKVLLEYELEELKYNRDSYVDGLNSSLEEASKKYEVYLKIKNGETITVTAPESGLYRASESSMVFVKGVEVKAGESAGSVYDINEFNLTVNDTEQQSVKHAFNGALMFNTEVTVMSLTNEIKGSVTESSSFIKSYTKAGICLDDPMQVLNINKNSVSVKYKNMEIDNVLLISSAYLQYESSDTGFKFFVYTEYGDSVVKKYVEAANTSDISSEYTWIINGLHEGDVCVKY